MSFFSRKSGPLYLMGPVSLTNFQDTNRWLPVCFDPTIVTQTYPSKNLQLQVIGANHTNSMVFGGVRGRWRLYPSPDTGRIQFLLDYLAYTGASQAGDKSLFGIGYWQGATDFQVIAFGSLAGVDKKLCKAETANLGDTIINMTDATGALAGAPQQIRVTFYFDIGGAMNPRRHVLGNSAGPLIVEYYIAGAWNNFNAGGGRIWKTGLNHLRGLEVYIGLLGGSVNNGHICQMGNFLLSEGILAG